MANTFLTCSMIFLKFSAQYLVELTSNSKKSVEKIPTLESVQEETHCRISIEDCLMRLKFIRVSGGRPSQGEVAK